MRSACREFVWVQNTNCKRQVTREADKWEKQAKRDMKGKLVPINKKQKEMVRAFQTGGWLVHEPVIRAELDIMQREAAQFRFANLADIDVRSLRQYIETVLAAKCAAREAAALAQPAAAGSAQARAFAKAPSQSQPVASGQDPSQVLATQKSPEQETISADDVLAELDELDAEAMF